jgi:hypothetical protein
MTRGAAPDANPVVSPVEPPIGVLVPLVDGAQGEGA